MRRGGIRLLPPLMAVLLAAMLLAACGSSSDSASNSGTNGGEATSTQGKGEETSSNSSDEGESEAADKGKKSGEPKPDVATPLTVSGGGSQQFVAKGGDNSIQEFGGEADESELQAAAEATHGFFVARAEGRWADACSHLSASLLGQLRQLAEKSERANCASFLGSFTTRLSPAVWREITTVDAGSLRREGDKGFLIYYGPKKAVYAMPLVEEDGAWKVGALSGDALQG